MAEHQLRVRLSAEDHERLLRLAGAERRTMSEMVRWALESYERHLALPPQDGRHAKRPK